MLELCLCGSSTVWHCWPTRSIQQSHGRLFKRALSFIDKVFTPNDQLFVGPRDNNRQNHILFFPILVLIKSLGIHISRKIAKKS